MKFSTTTIDSVLNRSFKLIKKELNEANWQNYVDDKNKLFYLKDSSPYVVTSEKSSNTFSSLAVKTISFKSNLEKAINIIGSDPVGFIRGADKDRKSTRLNFSHVDS